jgi:hypothetical protein
LRAYLDATYALVIDELAEQGVARSTVIDSIEKTLAEPLADELSAEMAEMMRRKRIAMENAPALESLAARADWSRGG